MALSNALLTESGFRLLMESGDSLHLESDFGLVRNFTRSPYIQSPLVGGGLI